MRPQKELIGEVADQDSPTLGRSDGEQGLMLLRREAGLPRGLLGKLEETAHLEAETRERRVIFLVDLFHQGHLLALYRITI
jgi:hypothetical protein